MPTPSSTRRLLLTTTAAAVALAAIMAAPTATAQPCTAITDNVLTSDFCPTSCSKEYPCVLYSPTTSQTVEACKETGAAGSCQFDESYSVADAAGAASTCNVTFQCLKSIVVNKNVWKLALIPSSLQNQISTAGVTRVQQLTYPTTDVTTVEVIGGLGRNARGDVKNVKLDNSFFATPPLVTSFYLSDMNLRNALTTVDFSTRTWTRVSFTNANLLEVPAGLGKLAGLNYLILSKNLIANITDPAPFTKVTELNLAYNELKDLTVALPAVVTLNLTGNPLAKIPDVIFGMKTLRTLAIRQSNLSNIALTDAQFTFLQQLTTLDADFVTTTCPNGTISQTFPTGAGSVCIPGSAPTTAPTETAKSSSNSTAIIVGIVAGVVVVALLAFFLCRKKKQPDNSTYTTINKFGDTTNGTTSTDNTGGTGIWGDPDLLAVRIEYRDIEPIKLLSRGGFGEVWLGLYMGENVAIKRLLSEKKTMDDALAFAAEVKIMARLDHPKVVRFIGVAWTSALTIQAVTEFMDCGDLRSLLDSSRAPSLTWANLKCQIAIDIADALVYLHTLNPKLIHRDLKSRNVLIDANTGAKLSDFGISRNRSVEETMTAGVGTSRWIAPEVIMGGHYTEFADIYSFGVVLSELDTAKSPFHDAVNTNGAKMPDVTILQLVSAGKLQPSFEPGCPESIVKLARACLSYDPAQRPSAIHISYELRKIMKDYL